MTAATAAGGRPGSAPAPSPAKVSHPEDRLRGAPHRGSRVSIPRSLETDRKQTGSPGVTAGFRFPRRQWHFPSKGSHSGNAAEGFPSLSPRLRQDRRSPAGRLGRELLGGGAEPPPENTRYPATRARDGGPPVPASSALAQTGSRARPEEGLPLAAGSAPGPRAQTGTQSPASSEGVLEACAFGAEGAESRSDVLRFP